MELTKTIKAKGYKQTEVGLIPQDWEVVTLGDYIKLKNGYAFKSENFGKIGPILVTPGNFKLEGGLKLEQKNTIHYSGFISNQMLFDYGDLIMVMTDLTPDCNLLGKSGIIDVKEKLLHNQRIGKIIIIKKDIDKNFLNVYFNSYLFSKRMKSTATGSTVRHTSVPTIKNSLVILPPVSEQKAIATALSDVDALLLSLDKQITKKKAIKQGVMQELLTPPNLGGKRLPGFEGEWERVKIEKVINVARGGSPRPIQDFITSLPDGVNWIKIGDTSPLSKYITSSVEKITPEGANYSRKVYEGDFLLSNSMSFGRPYILKIDGCIHDGWLVLQNYSQFFDKEFLYYTLMSEDVFNQYLAKASGSGVLNLNKELVKVVELNRPKQLQEQKAIAQILSDMDIEIASLEAKRQKYVAIKQGMMQELLTGRTRLV